MMIEVCLHLCHLPVCSHKKKSTFSTFHAYVCIKLNTLHFENTKYFAKGRLQKKILKKVIIITFDTPRGAADTSRMAVDTATFTALTSFLANFENFSKCFQLF